MEKTDSRRTNGNGGIPLTPREAMAARETIRRVRRYVPAELVQALLFGSKARRNARPDSDVDLLLIFRDLPPDREPHASIAEVLAEQVADQAGVPVAPWSVSLADLERGMRTPMLVDALDDGVPLWPVGQPPPRLAFTPQDALRCSGALLQRVAEGSLEVARRRLVGDAAGAVHRGRDDLVRLCTAALLLSGETRPRRAAAVGRFIAAEAERGGFPHEHLPLLRWAELSFGPQGKDEELTVPPPAGGLAALAFTVDRLRALVAGRRNLLAARLPLGWNPAAEPEYDQVGRGMGRGCFISYTRGMTGMQMDER